MTVVEYPLSRINRQLLEEGNLTARELRDQDNLSTDYIGEGAMPSKVTISRPELQALTRSHAIYQRIVRNCVHIVDEENP